ncbi:hypothetical protein B0T24DRAFT_623051 [Lasiosphaeria ovina]|uniref:Secreted protein n=1 Tax=Lasiosphaeria ovina TaxID=92902 RepID=A0AAE0KB22_9PEZI|nr:hypothetical protein B0T24DRAFT_623051 [Lasiosphaeria ovina]
MQARAGFKGRLSLSIAIAIAIAITTAPREGNLILSGTCWAARWRSQSAPGCILHLVAINSRYYDSDTYCRPSLTRASPGTATVLGSSVRLSRIGSCFLLVVYYT